MYKQDEEQQEKYLRENGWFKISHELWNHKNCHYDCCLDVALDVQRLREKRHAAACIP